MNRTVRVWALLKFRTQKTDIKKQENSHLPLPVKPQEVKTTARNQKYGGFLYDRAQRAEFTVALHVVRAAAWKKNSTQCKHPDLNSSRCLPRFGRSTPDSAALFHSLQIKTAIEGTGPWEQPKGIHSRHGNYTRKTSHLKKFKKKISKLLL